MAALAIHAGERAKARLLDEGFHADLFDALIGASGGPKWFILHGLDQFLFGEFFRSRQRPLYTLGSSAGAWRMCCLATADPVAAIDRLAALYSNERYSAQPTSREVSDQARTMLVRVLGGSGAREIVDNKVFRTHIITDRCRHLRADSSRLKQGAVLAAAAGFNVISRSTLSWFFERTIFSNSPANSPWSSLQDLSSCIVPLSVENVFDAMMASGSIPFVLEGVEGIACAPDGLYWDGGITDYHFDLPFNDIEGLVLYPHFQSAVIPGWFDKKLTWRHASAQHYSNVVLLSPSAEFVAGLPDGKLSDRSDFSRLGFAERVQVFRKVLEQGQVLADELRRLIENGIDERQIQPIGNLQ